jgi:hypothetical protein
MPQVNYQEQQLRFLIWFLRKRIYEILSGLNRAKRPETNDIRDILKNILESVTLAEYLTAPINEKIDQLTQFKHFVQTLSGADIHGNEAFRRGPDAD